MNRWRVDLHRTMDRYGIHEALIVDSLSFDYHPEVGNTRDVYQVAEQERLHPAWAVLPPGSREAPQAHDLLAACSARDRLSVVRRIRGVWRCRRSVRRRSL